MELKSLIKGKKGVLGLDTAKAVIIALLVLAVTAIAVLLAISSIRTAGIFPAGSIENTSATYISENISNGMVNFFKQVPTFFTLLAVVVLILIIAIVIVAVSRFSGGAGGAGSL